MTPTEPAASSRLPSSRLLWINAALAVLVVVALVLLIAVGALGKLVGGPDDERGAAFDAVSDAASKESLAFMTVDHRRMDDLMQAVLDGATGDFKQEYEKASPQLKSTVEAQQTVSTGKILSVAVSELDGDSATAFVAADSKVSNVGTQGKTVPRYYRLQLDLTKVKGEWLVSKLQFVG